MRKLSEYVQLPQTTSELPKPTSEQYLGPSTQKGQSSGSSAKGQVVTFSVQWRPLVPHPRAQGMLLGPCHKKASCSHGLNFKSEKVPPLKLMKRTELAQDLEDRSSNPRPTIDLTAGHETSLFTLALVFSSVKWG